MDSEEPFLSGFALTVRSSVLNIAEQSVPPRSVVVRLLLLFRSSGPARKGVVILSGIPRTGPKRRASQGWRSHREAAHIRPLLARESRAAGMVWKGRLLEFLPWKRRASMALSFLRWSSSCYPPRKVQILLSSYSSSRKNLATNGLQGASPTKRAFSPTKGALTSYRWGGVLLLNGPVETLESVKRCRSLPNGRCRLEAIDRRLNFA